MFTFSHLQLSGMRSIHSTQKDFSYTNHGKNKNKNSNPLDGINFVHNPFQSFMASKTSNKHWSKVNSTYRLKVGNKENGKFEERKKMEFLGKKENRIVPRTFL